MRKRYTPLEQAARTAKKDTPIPAACAELSGFIKPGSAGSEFFDALISYRDSIHREFDRRLVTAKTIADLEGLIFTAGWLRVAMQEEYRIADDLRTSVEARLKSRRRALRIGGCASIEEREDIACLQRYLDAMKPFDKEVRKKVAAKDLLWREYQRCLFDMIQLRTGSDGKSKKPTKKWLADLAKRMSALAGLPITASQIVSSAQLRYD